jgi:hypothetical protein
MVEPTQDGDRDGRAIGPLARRARPRGAACRESGGSRPGRRPDTYVRQAEHVKAEQDDECGQCGGFGAHRRWPIRSCHRSVWQSQQHAAHTRDAHGGPPPAPPGHRRGRGWLRGRVRGVTLRSRAGGLWAPLSAASCVSAMAGRCQSWPVVCHICFRLYGHIQLGHEEAVFVSSASPDRGVASRERSERLSHVSALWHQSLDPVPLARRLRPVRPSLTQTALSASAPHQAAHLGGAASVRGRGTEPSPSCLRQASAAPHPGARR